MNKPTPSYCGYRVPFFLAVHDALHWRLGLDEKEGVDHTRERLGGLLNYYHREVA